jgi:glycine betaine/proline transport system substrate-binding protein
MRTRFLGKFLLWLTIGLSFTLVLAACNQGERERLDPTPTREPVEEEAAAEEPVAEEAAEEAVTEEEPAEEAATGDKMTISFAENPWSGSQVNVAVAKILLEEQLGYPVEIVTIDENAQWSALASGDIQASLEVWPSGHAENVALYIDEQKSVENAGLLGPVGVIGWFMPSYMLEKDSDLATWEGFKKPETAELFATAETGDKGQFLAGDQSWVQYDGDIINNLELPFEVVTAGSEEALLAALESAYSREDSILFYFWTPHSVHAKYDLTQVELPSYSEECYAGADSGGVDCAYPADDLFKIVSAQLKDEAPDAYEFLENFNYSTEDQIQMIAAVELDGKTPEEAAREWIDGNEDKWKAWLP